MQRDLQSRKISEKQEKKNTEWFNKYQAITGVSKEDMTNIANDVAYAQWYRGAITLFKGSTSADLYHEAFHDFTQLYLTKKQKKIYDFIESVDPNDIPSLMNKFINREEKYEEFQYSVMHRHKCSDLFNIVFDIATQYGNNGEEVLNKYDSAFIGGAYEYKGYGFVVYIGQGSFYRIFKDGECIFQTT